MPKTEKYIWNIGSIFFLNNFFFLQFWAGSMSNRTGRDLILWGFSEYYIRNTNYWIESIVTVGVFPVRFSDKETHDNSFMKGLKLIYSKNKNT